MLKAALLHDKIYRSPTDQERIERVCDMIISGLEMRYIDHAFEAVDVSKEQKNNYEKFRSRVDDLKKLFPDDFTAKMECKALAQSYIDTFIKTLTKIEKRKDETVNNKFAVHSIQDTIEILNSYKFERHSASAERAFLQTIVAFLSFYAGIFSCCRSQMKYEFEKSTAILCPKEIKIHQDKIKDEFFIGVAGKAAELAKKIQNGNAIEEILKELFRFATKVADEGYYNAVLARPPVNAVRLGRIFREVNGEIIFIDSKGEFCDFAHAVNNGVLIKYLYDITNFLSGEEPDDMRRKENYDKSNYAAYKEHAKRVVYPQIVVFSKHREDGDSNDCLIMDHSGAFAGWHDGEVQILTEFKYKINHAYYALPNINRIETEWWVDPLMVSCYKFDEEIRKATSSVKK